MWTPFFTKTIKKNVRFPLTARLPNLQNPPFWYRFVVTDFSTDHVVQRLRLVYQVGAGLNPPGLKQPSCGNLTTFLVGGEKYPRFKRYFDGRGLQIKSSFFDESSSQWRGIWWDFFRITVEGWIFLLQENCSSWGVSLQNFPVALAMDSRTRTQRSSTAAVADGENQWALFKKKGPPGCPRKLVNG